MMDAVPERLKSSIRRKCWARVLHEHVEKLKIIKIMPMACGHKPIKNIHYFFPLHDLGEYTCVI